MTLHVLKLKKRAALALRPSPFNSNGRLNTVLVTTKSPSSRVDQVGGQIGAKAVAEKARTRATRRHSDGIGTMPISAIILGKRHRRDLGDIGILQAARAAGYRAIGSDIVDRPGRYEGSPSASATGGVFVTPSGRLEVMLITNEMAAPTRSSPTLTVLAHSAASCARREAQQTRRTTHDHRNAETLYRPLKHHTARL